MIAKHFADNKPVDGQVSDGCFAVELVVFDALRDGVEDLLELVAAAGIIIALLAERHAFKFFLKIGTKRHLN